jgi:hypothetical protein
MRLRAAQPGVRLKALPVFLAGVAIIGVLAGCSSTPTTGTGGTDPSVDASATDSGSGDPTVAPTTAVPPTCTLASAAVIKSTLGVDVQEPTQSADDTLITCTYAPAADGRTVLVRFTTDSDASVFARGRQQFDSGGQPTSDVPGVLDGAYTSSTEFGDVVTNTLVARKGSVEMQVTAVATVDAEKTLVTKVLAGLS